MQSGVQAVMRLAPDDADCVEAEAFSGGSGGIDVI
jgi:hypothetical protein